jgi:hypothetical protein
MAFSREMSLRYQSIAAWELYTMFLRLNSVWSVYNFQERFTEKVAIIISATMQAPFLTTSWEVNGTLEHIVNFSYFLTAVNNKMTSYHLIEIERE